MCKEENEKQFYWDKYCYKCNYPIEEITLKFSRKNNTKGNDVANAKIHSRIAKIPQDRLRKHQRQHQK